MFKVKVVGDYVARSAVMDKEKIRKTYEVEGIIPTTKAALSIVKNKLLGPALSKKYSDYVTFLTYNIVQITPLTPEAQAEMQDTEVMYMNREALLAFIKTNALPVDARYYPDLFKLREAVQYAKEDPKGYLNNFALREPDLRLDLEMAKCNPGLFKTEDDSGLIAKVSIPPPIKAKPKTEHVKMTGDRLKGLKSDMIRDNELGDLDPENAVAADTLDL